MILYQKPNINFWMNDISMLQKINSGEELKQQSNQLDRIGAKPEIEITQEISLGEDSAQRILNSWKPWQIIKTVTSSASNLKVTRLELNVGEDIQKEQSALYLSGMLSIN